MKSRTILRIGVTIILCLTAFVLGRMSRSKQGVNSIALLEDRALLMILRSGDSTGAIKRLESYLDLEVYGAMTCRSSLKGKDRDRLDAMLKKVASYRERFPRPIDAPSPDSRATEQRQIDEFLHYIATQPNPALQATPTNAEAGRCAVTPAAGIRSAGSTSAAAAVAPTPLGYRYSYGVPELDR
jgi:hypothetical protein